MKILEGPSCEEIKNSIENSNLLPQLILHKAIANNSLQGVKMAFDKGVSLDYYSSYAINFASYKGNLNIVKYLIENDFDVNGNDSYPLIAASKNGHLSVVKYLVENGAKIVKEAVLHAKNNRNLEIVNYLEDQHTENIRNISKDTS